MDAADSKYVSLGLRIVGEFGAIIAVPIVLFALAGKWLDGRYGTKPWFLIAGFALAAAVSSISIARKAKAFDKEYKDIEAEGKRIKGKG
jgi:F0F1-type ATP synthase assembly protein I